jgi:hypothetical protein
MDITVVSVKDGFSEYTVRWDQSINISSMHDGLFMTLIRNMFTHACAILCPYNWLRHVCTCAQIRNREGTQTEPRLNSIQQATKFELQNLKEACYLGDHGIDGRITLKYILKEIKHISYWSMLMMLICWEIV